MVKASRFVSTEAGKYKSYNLQTTEKNSYGEFKRLKHIIKLSFWWCQNNSIQKLETKQHDKSKHNKGKSKIYIIYDYNIHRIHKKHNMIKSLTINEPLTYQLPLNWDAGPPGRLWSHHCRENPSPPVTNSTGDAHLTVQYETNPLLSKTLWKLPLPPFPKLVKLILPSSPTLKTESDPFSLTSIPEMGPRWNPFSGTENPKCKDPSNKSAVKISKDPLRVEAANVAFCDWAVKRVLREVTLDGVAYDDWGARLGGGFESEFELDVEGV